MNHLNIRPAKQQDLPSIGRIADQTALFPSDMLDDMIENYLRQKSQDIWFVGEHAAQIVSFGFCEPERMTEGTWNLQAIGVAPQHQGAGYGSQMMTYIENRLAAQGERILLVETMGTPDFARTREFYHKSAYVAEARIREFYAPGEDKIVFWKQL